MNRLTIFLAVMIGILCVFMLLGSHYYNLECEYADELLGMVKEQQVQIEELLELVRDQRAIIDTYEDFISGDMEIVIKPKQEVTH